MVVRYAAGGRAQNNILQEQEIEFLYVTTNTPSFLYLDSLRVVDEYTAPYQFEYSTNCGTANYYKYGLYNMNDYMNLISKADMIWCDIVGCPEDLIPIYVDDLNGQIDVPWRLPLNEDGSSNRMCQFILDVSKNINNFLKKNKFELPIFFWDESYTSFEALERTYDLYKNIKSQKKTIDKFAAKIILEDFLDQI